MEQKAWMWLVQGMETHAALPRLQSWIIANPRYLLACLPGLAL
jgi:hypothetical protein